MYENKDAEKRRTEIKTPEIQPGWPAVTGNAVTAGHSKRRTK